MGHDLVAQIMRFLILLMVIAIVHELKDINTSTHETSITLEKIRSQM